MYVCFFFSFIDRLYLAISFSRTLRKGKERGLGTRLELLGSKELNFSVKRST